MQQKFIHLTCKLLTVSSVTLNANEKTLLLPLENTFSTSRSSADKASNRKSVNHGLTVVSIRHIQQVLTVYIIQICFNIKRALSHTYTTIITCLSAQAQSTHYYTSYKETASSKAHGKEEKESGISYRKAKKQQRRYFDSATKSKVHDKNPESF